MSTKAAATKGTTAKHAGGAKHPAASGSGAAKKHQPATAHKSSAPAKAKAPKPAQHAKPATAKRKLSIGEISCCSARAVAASAWLAGWPVGDADVIELHEHLTDDPDSGASIFATLQAALRHGIGGVRPRGFGAVRGLGDGVIAGTTLPSGLHAVTIDGDGFWTWGEWHPFGSPYLRDVDEAWYVRWPQ